MKNTYIILTTLVVITAAALVYGFTSAGSPFAARRALLDEKRISGFNVIGGSIEAYYSKNGQLPAQLSDLNSAS